MNKQARYRARLVADGRCPHCGKKAEPYYYCAERRFAKRLYNALRRMIAWGAIRRVSRGLYETDVAGARGPRGHYRVDPSGQAPRGFEKFAVEFLRARGTPAPAEEIATAFIDAKRRLRASAASHRPTVPSTDTKGNV